MCSIDLSLVSLQKASSLCCSHLALRPYCVETKSCNVRVVLGDRHYPCRHDVLFSFIAITGILSKAESAGQELCSKLYTDDTVVYATGQMCDTNPPNALLVIGLVFACFWTQQVIENIMHVTTAGVVGSWWFNAMADPSYCSPTLTSSLTRSLTYSFGSICFGSLLVAIIQTLERARYSRNGRPHRLPFAGRSFQFSKWMVCALCAHPYYDTGSV
jgi:hypothetical protein